MIPTATTFNILHTNTLSTSSLYNKVMTFYSHHKRVIYVAAVISPIWMLGNCMYKYSLLWTTVGSSTIIRWVCDTALLHAIACTAVLHHYMNYILLLLYYCYSITMWNSIMLLQYITSTYTTYYQLLKLWQLLLQLLELLHQLQQYIVVLPPLYLMMSWT